MDHIECRHCEGRGIEDEEGTPCPDCDGTGRDLSALAADEDAELVTLCDLLAMEVADD